MTQRWLRRSFAIALFAPPGLVGADFEHVEAARIGVHYAELAHAMYADSQAAAEQLQRAVLDFIAAPSEAGLGALRNAWSAARNVYSQTEAFRFGNSNVDQWEGRVNAWPVDEGFIDYVVAGYEHDIGNLHARFNFVASDVVIDTDSVRLRHEHGGIEANVATGFHAIEFLLWGQDLNTDETAAGQRPFTDYLAGSACTNPPCDRRGRYLREVAGLLVADLREMTVDWEAEVGEYRRYFDGLPNGEKIRRMLVGLGSMAGGELAGERLRVPLLAAAQEDEHSCFSDTTHFDIYYNVVGIRNLYLGTYKSAAGEMLVGPAPADWVRNIDPGLHERLMAELASAEARAEAIVERAGSGLPFDRQILGTDPESLGTLAALIDHLEQAAAVFDEALGAL